MIINPGYVNSLTVFKVGEYLKNFDNILIKDPEFSSQLWWYEDKLEYLRNLSIYGVSSIPVISLTKEGNTLVILKEANKLVTLKCFLEGSINVPPKYI